jgi:hypothetical protein
MRNLRDYAVITASYWVFTLTDGAMRSFLILHYADGDKVSLNVGFYYMANAAGRPAGTILTGAVFQWAGMGADGLLACLVASTAFVVVSLVLCMPLRAAETCWRDAEIIQARPLLR